MFLKFIEEFGRALGIVALGISGKPLVSRIFTEDDLEFF